MLSVFFLLVLIIYSKIYDSILSIYINKIKQKFENGLILINVGI